MKTASPLPPSSLCAKCSRHVVIRHVKADGRGADPVAVLRIELGPWPKQACSPRPSPTSRRLQGSHSGPHTLKERTKAKLFGSLSRSHVASSDRRTDRVNARREGGEQNLSTSPFREQCRSLEGLLNQGFVKVRYVQKGCIVPVGQYLFLNQVCVWDVAKEMKGN